MSTYRSCTTPTTTTTPTTSTTPTTQGKNCEYIAFHTYHTKWLKHDYCGTRGRCGSTYVDIPHDHPSLRFRTAAVLKTTSTIYNRDGLSKIPISRAYINNPFSSNKFLYLFPLLFHDYTIYGSLYLFRPGWFMAETEYGWISCLLQAIWTCLVLSGPTQLASRTQIEKDKDINKGIEFNRNSGFSIAGRVNDELKVNDYVSISVDNESTDTTVVPGGHTLTIDNGASVDILLTQFLQYFHKIYN